jgi:hypothetical protein
MNFSSAVTGLISGAVTLDTGAALKPGASIGTLTFGGNLTAGAAVRRSR